MRHADIRKTFIDYFAANGHTVVKPSNIIPSDDPTLLFTNAGMNQFKDALLGREKRDYTRAANSQPCMRVGGKHNDLDAVGNDGRHNTWFEMLGNWSFGDYYKEEAIAFAWELVTKHYDIDTSRLYASVYKDDDESAALWKRIANLPNDRIVRLGDIDKGDEENFWSMGPVGPCGPCTELYYDQGAALGEDVVGGETDRYLEFWNLVFMEFNRDENGALTPLPMKSVDTGMGLERITAIKQGKTNVFHTDVFMPIIAEIAEKTGREFAGADAAAMCVVADHARALTFVVADGGVFDRAGRGYVLRRILRRATLHGHHLGMNEPWIHTLVPTVIDVTGHTVVDPATVARVQAAIRDEEEKFFRTLDRGIVYFTKTLDTLKQGSGRNIGGDDAFLLYDTYGFPIDLTRILAEKEGYGVDLTAFDDKLEEQRTRSRDAGQFYDEGGWETVATGPESGFAGYDIETLTVTPLRFRATETGYDLVLDKTPFYVEGGGEESDRGRLTADRLDMTVDHVNRTDAGVIHTGRFVVGGPDDLRKAGALTATVDLVRRRAKAAHHTATHLLHAALRKTLGDSVQQKGSLVTQERFRFDFAANRAMTPDEIAVVEEQVNRWIAEGRSVVRHVDVPFQEALDMGALAFFSDKYGDKVRVVDIPETSTELCGGNHVADTAAVGGFVILAESSVGSGVRRVEGVAQTAAARVLSQYRNVVDELTAGLNVTVDQLPGRVAQLTETIKKLTREKEKLAKEALSGKGAANLDDEIVAFDGVPTLVKAIDVGDAASLKEAVDALRNKRPDGVFILVGETDDRGFVVIGVGAEAVKRGLNAGKLAKEIGGKLGSGGGGRPDFAQTGFKGHTTDEATAIARDALAARIGAV
jgi:alanyl-tRNA synthetase